jgi:anti-sigma factor RsiW
VLTHYRTRRRIGAYLDGALDEGWARTAASHLEACATCQRDADELRRLKTLMVRAAAAAASPDWVGFWPGVVRRIEDGRVRKPVEIGWRWPRAVWQPRLAFGGAVAAALLVTLGLWNALYSPTGFDGGIVVSAARTEIPDATVMVYSPPERDIAVVWLFDQN